MSFVWKEWEVVIKETSIDWAADEWFAKYHAEALTDEFKEWWIKHYGVPREYSGMGEQDEYWIRCAYAWIGWFHSQKTMKTKDKKDLSNTKKLGSTDRIHEANRCMEEAIRMMNFIQTPLPPVVRANIGRAAILIKNWCVINRK